MFSAQWEWLNLKITAPSAGYKLSLYGPTKVCNPCKHKLRFFYCITDLNMKHRLGNWQSVVDNEAWGWQCTVPCKKGRIGEEENNNKEKTEISWSKLYSDAMLFKASIIHLKWPYLAVVHQLCSHPAGWAPKISLMWLYFFNSFWSSLIQLKNYLKMKPIQKLQGL